ncbi:hypothetical protein D9619_007824 [Psilocybe cf. subviscida]|uniref:F-box domain-containing protein n=1 Tax=Psilocybe cf. subviscida TaxID=2480587 RepID=A0A8H5AU75_9AGAR|nr:hypothetical protein D9619_007824 [Psilocybe cf. subviscida]
MSTTLPILPTLPASPSRCREKSTPPEHSLIASLQGDVNPQTDSPLFSKIPPELRNDIFQLMLTSYDDELAPLETDEYFSRHRYRFRRRTDTALLSTCRRIYLEAHDLPVSLNEHVFWMNYHGPPGVKYHNKPIAHFWRLTAEQREAIENVHIFAPSHWLQGSLGICKSRVFRMKHLKISIRQTDWYGWEYNHPSTVMPNGWAASLKLITNLESFEMELEIVERDKLQLEALVKSMQPWRIQLANDRVLTTEGNNVVRRRYTGPSDYGGGMHYDFQTNEWSWDGDITHQDAASAPPLYYVGYTLLWTAMTV